MQGSLGPPDKLFVNLKIARKIQIGSIWDTKVSNSNPGNEICWGPTGEDTALRPLNSKKACRNIGIAVCISKRRESMPRAAES